MHRFHDMPHDRVTDKDGRWHLRQGYLDNDEHTYITVVSEWAPKGMPALNLIPEQIEVTSDLDDDTIVLPIATLRELMQWGENS